jgi:hypothetical protein
MDMFSVGNVLVPALIAVTATKMVELIERLPDFAGSLARCFHFQIGDEPGKSESRSLDKNGPRVLKENHIAYSSYYSPSLRVIHHIIV